MNANSCTPRHLTLLITLMTAALFVAVPTALAAHPKVKTFKTYLAPSGPDKGTLTVLITADYRHFATKADVPAGKRPPRTWAILRLNDGAQTILAADTYRLSPSARSGAPVRFRFVFPAKKARELDRAALLKVRLSVGLKGHAAHQRLDRNGARRSTRQFDWCALLLSCGADWPAPAAEVGFGTYSNSVCLIFNGSGGYAGPALSQLALWDGAGNALIGGGNSAFLVAANGSFSDVGFEQPSSGGVGDITVTLSGSLPTSLLNAPANASTGPIVLYDSGAPWGEFSNPITLPYSASVSTNDC